MDEKRLHNQKLVYAVALAFIALTLLVSSLLMQYVISQNGGDSRVINLAGRQRMLSQRLTKCVIVLEHSTSDEDRAGRTRELTESFESWKEVHLGLQRGDKKLGLPQRENSPEIRAFFAAMEPSYSAMVKGLERLQEAGGSTDPAALHTAAAVMLTNESRFLSLMDKITFQFDQEAKERISSMQRLEKVVLLVGLLILVFEFFVVFRPSVARVTVMMTSLKIKGEQLAEANGILQESLANSQRLTELANSTKSEFLARMNHEIRTPMNAILGFSELLLPLAQDRKQKEYLRSISSSGRALLHLINDILDLSKVEAGKLNIVLGAFSLGPLLNEIRQIFSQRLTEKGLSFECDIAPSVPGAVILDSMRLRQILLNLVGNAVKFTDSGGIRVQVSAVVNEGEPDRCDIEIRVEDTGIGIPEGERDKVFEAFEQKTGQNHARRGGTGLGLTITRKLTTLMNGSVRAEANPGGRGSVFVVTFHAVSTAVCLLDESPHSAPLAAVTYHFLPARILLVDDIMTNRMLLKAFLEQQSFTFVEAEDGESALRLMREQRPDLVITDIKMPRLSGDALARSAGEDPELRHIPIIAVTASVMPAKMEEIRRLFRSVLLKPLRRRDLLAEVARILPVTRTDQLHPAVLSVEPDGPCADAAGLIQDLMALDAEYQIVRRTLQVNRVKQFHGAVSILAVRYDAPELQAWGDSLAAALSSFNITQVKAEMNRYEEAVSLYRSRAVSG